MTDKDIRFTVSAEDRFGQTFARLKRDIADGGANLDRFAVTAGRVSSALSLISFGGAAAGVGFGAAFKQLATDLDALNDASDALGDSVENLSALENVARRNGAGLDLVSTAVLKLNKVLGEAKPDSPLSVALQAIGLNAAELRQLDPSEALQRVAVALQGYANDGNRARIVQELFGKSTREVAAFLKDLAEAGQLNATVTTAQAAAAERFNKELAAISTNAGNAARALVGGLLPALNEDLVRLRTGTEVFGGLGRALLAFTKEGARFSDAGAGVASYSKELAKLEQTRALVAKNGKEDPFRGSLGDIDAQIEKLKKFETFYRRVFVLTAPDNGQSSPTELARRGRGVLPSAPDITGAGGSNDKKVSEALRYLETLEKQSEKLQSLSTVQQLLADLENKRIDGVKPKIRTRLFLEAATVDVLKQQGSELKAQQDSLDELIAKTERRSSKLQGLLDATPTGRAKEAERNVNLLESVSRANPKDEALQRVLLEAVKAQRSAFDQAIASTAEQTKEIDKLTVVVDRFADQTVDAFVDLATGAEGAASRLGKAFERDLLRALVEDPIRDTMKSAVKIIRDELGQLDGDNNPLAKIFGFFKNMGGGGGGQAGGGFDFSAWIGSLFGGGSTTRAGGGGVRGGQLVRWQENGREFFVPGQDGTVVRQDQMGAAAVAGPVTNIFNINGATNPREVARQVSAVVDARDARSARAARFGRTAFATEG